MFKISYDLGSINHTIGMEFIILVNTPSENPMFQNNNAWKYQKTFQHFTLNGTEYLKIRPSAYISIDFRRHKKDTDVWDSNDGFNLNHRNRFFMIWQLKNFIKKFREIKDLFVYTDSTHRKLELNLRHKDECTFTMRLSNNKIIRMEPAVIESTGDNEIIYYEGAILYINGINNYAYLTNAEIEYLIYRLEELNMETMTTTLLTIAELHKDMDYGTISVKHNPNEPENTELSRGSIVKIEHTETIPNI